MKRRPAAAREVAVPRGPAPALAVPRGLVAALAVAAAVAIAACVSFPLNDPDVWQHLLVGKVTWAQKHVPTTEQWSWPTYGAPAVTPSWLFRALLWPFWAAGGPAGLWAWRWLTTLAAFAIAWAACRRAGARGHWALLGLVWCAIVYRHRSMPRPESIVVLLIALHTWVLVRLRTRRDGESPARIAVWLVPIAWAWANVHLSYPAGFALTVFHAVGERFPRRRSGPPPATGTLALALAACVAVSFANPFGWRALAQPFEFWFVGRHEPLYQNVLELRPVDWAFHASSLLPAWLAATGLLALWGWRRRGFELSHFLVLACFAPAALASQRFLGPFALLAAPFFARDLDQWMSSRPWPQGLRRPAVQAALALAAMAALATVACRDPAFRPGWGIRWQAFPVRACDWMQDHDVRGRGFNFFELGGYLAWRSWPERDRLPFMDIHQAGTPLDRTLLTYARSDSSAWERLDQERRFDWAVLSPRVQQGDRLLEVLDRDTTTWALVSWDDAGALYLRRGGRMAALAERERYRLMPGGAGRLGALSAAIDADSTVRAALRAELERAAASSRWNGSAHNRLASIDQFERRYAGARAHLLAARAARPDIPHFDERMGLAWLLDGRPRDALPYLERASRAARSPTADLHLGEAFAALGRREDATRAYRRALERPEAREQAREALARLQAAP